MTYSTIVIKDVEINEKKNTVDIYFAHFSLLARTSIKNLNSACSSAKVTKGRNSELYVITKSTIPYSSVDNIVVYSGNKKKLTN